MAGQERFAAAIGRLLAAAEPHFDAAKHRLASRSAAKRRLEIGRASCRERV